MPATEKKNTSNLDAADGELRVVRKTRLLPHIATAIVVLIGLSFAYSVYTTPHIDHAVVWQYLFDEQILLGVQQTVYLTLVSMFLGIVLGAVLVAMGNSGSAGLRQITNFYIWLFRGTPILVQIIVFFNLGLVFPEISISLPGFGPILGPIDTNYVMTPFLAAILGLALNEAAYMSEIFRSGFMGVKQGEREAGKALGMPPWLLNRRIVFPQVIRICLPATGNEFITMLKSTALVSVVAYGELMTRAGRIYTANARVMELLIVVCFWYLILTTILSVAQGLLERHFGKMERKVNNNDG